MVGFYWQQAFVDVNTYREAIMLLSLIWAYLHFQPTVLAKPSKRSVGLS
jgi:hypothetical protein